jgi:hypothetical protein
VKTLQFNRTGESHCCLHDVALSLAIGERTPRYPSTRTSSRTPAGRTPSLRHFVVTTHWDEKTLPLTMPNPELMDPQIADVVAYILSLRTQ